MKKNSELENALAFFEKNPCNNKYHRKENEAFSSYLNSNGRILRLYNKTEANAFVGKGAFGSVKKSDPIGDELGNATCVKIQKVRTDYGLLEAKKEAEINKDMGIAIGPLIEVKNAKGQKVYQEMRDLGIPLISKIKCMDFNQKINIVIDLISAVINMHAGITSANNNRYRHGDLHLRNVLIDKDNTIRIIDFLTARLVKEDDFEKDNGCLLKAIYSTENKLSLFTAAEFDRFSQTVQKALDPKNYGTLKNDDSLYYLIETFTEFRNEMLSVSTHSF